MLGWLILDFPLPPGEEAAKGAASFTHRINLTGYDPSDGLRSLAAEILMLGGLKIMYPRLRDLRNLEKIIIMINRSLRGQHSRWARDKHHCT